MRAQAAWVNEKKTVLPKLTTEAYPVQTRHCVMGVTPFLRSHRAALQESYACMHRLSSVLVPKHRTIKTRADGRSSRNPPSVPEWQVRSSLSTTGTPGTRTLGYARDDYWRAYSSATIQGRL